MTSSEPEIVVATITIEKVVSADDTTIRYQTGDASMIDAIGMLAFTEQAIFNDAMREAIDDDE